VTGPQGALLPRPRLGIGVALYLTAAILDIHMTLTGMGGVLELEGNPLIRATMRWLGLEAGLVTQKAAIGGVLTFIAVCGERAIRNQERWISKIPSTRLARNWMRKKDRSWIAYIPLYAVAIGQGFAAGSWVVVAMYS
jgi:hypothetical protein